MSISRNFQSIKNSNNSLAIEIERAASAPLENKYNRQERYIEDFLNDLDIRNKSINNEESKSDSITLNEDIRSDSVMSLQYESGDNDDNIKDNSYVSVYNEVDTLPVSNVNASIIVADLVPKNDPTSDGINQIEDATKKDDGEIDEPSVTANSIADINKNNNDMDLLKEKTSDFQIFTDQLNKLSATIQQKDEEIRKLSQKLMEFECTEKVKGQIECRSIKSPLFLPDESLTLTEEIKKKLNAEEKSAEKDNITHMDKPVDNNQSPNIHEDHINHTKENIVMKPTVDVPTVKIDEVIPGLRQKLCDLEEEVKRLQRANVDSILALQDIQNHSPANDRSSNDSVINRLLVDHSLLKEELDQLKWEHSKLTQPNILSEELKQLKEEVNVLRNQNELLQQYIKSSSTKSLNKAPETKLWRESLEDFNDDIKESLESPYHATCQSIQHAAPLSGGETYRARKLSDSSSALIEDIMPKVWLEPVSVNCKPMYYRPSNNYESPCPKSNRRETDQYSVDSFVTVTTSVTETDRDNWKHTNKNAYLDQNDLLSTADSDTMLDSTNRDDFQRKPKYSYSFTPKSPVDLTLEDLVKFARPGGKMSTGRVCFVGHLPGRREVCVGLELDEDAGKHDGIFESVRYFQCRKNRGVFISFHKIILAYKSL